MIESNPYAASNAVTDYSAPATESPALFYVVSKWKFLALFFGTFGLYLVYWVYKNWKCYRDNAGFSCTPWARALFAIFYFHALFDHMKARLSQLEIENKWNASLDATILVILLIIERVTGRIFSEPLVSLITFSALLVKGLILFRVQRYVNMGAGDPEGSGNNRFTLANFLWLLLGGIIWLLFLIGLVLLFVAPE